MDADDFAEMFAGDEGAAAPAYTRLGTATTTMLLDTAVFEGDGATDRTLAGTDACSFTHEKRGPMTLAAGLDFSQATMLDAIETEPFAIAGAPDSWRAHNYTAPLTRVDLSRALKTVLLAPAAHAGAIGAVVGFPGRAQNGDVPADELPVNAWPDAPKFTNEDLRDAAVIWDHATGSPNMAIAHNVALTADKLDAHLAALESAGGAPSAVGALRAAIARVFARIEQGPPSAAERAKLSKAEQKTWEALPPAPCGRETLVFTLTHYTPWPVAGAEVVKTSAIVDMIRGADNPLCAPLIAAKNRGTLRGTLKLRSPKGGVTSVLLKFAVPVVPAVLFDVLCKKMAAKAKQAAVAPPSPKKAQIKPAAATAADVDAAPVAADVGKLTTAATGDAIGTALARNATNDEPPPEICDPDAGAAKPAAKAVKREVSDDASCSDQLTGAQVPPKKTAAKPAKRKAAAAASKPAAVDETPPPKKAATPKAPKKKAKTAPTQTDIDAECATLGAAVASDTLRARNCFHIGELYERFNAMVAQKNPPARRRFSRVCEHDLDQKPVPRDVAEMISHFAQVSHYLNLHEPIGRALRAAHGTEPPAAAAAADDDDSDDMPDIFD